MKKIFIAVFCAVIVLWLISIFRGDYSRTEYLMDTVVTITADNKKAVDQCFLEIERLENMISCYTADSDTSKINSAPFGEYVNVHKEVSELLEKADMYKEITHGAFDISIKPVSDLWDIKGGGYVPTDEEISNALNCLSDIYIDGNRVALQKDGAQIDLGGIAKGYIGDKAKEILKSHNVKSAILDLGGNIVVIGNNGRTPWKIGIQDPSKPRGTTLGYVETTDKCVVTSGGYERFFQKDGKTYHHIFDTATGKNPDNDILSVTIISEDGTLADALSTSCFVLGKDKGLELAREMGAEAIIVTQKGVFMTQGTALRRDGGK